LDFVCLFVCFSGFLQKGKPDLMPHRITPKEEGRKTRELGKKIEMRVKKKKKGNCCSHARYCVDLGGGS
jgi:hypothetical protein